MAVPLRFPLALQRVEDELRAQPASGRSFVSNHLELDLVNVNRKEWVKAVADQVAAETYLPGPLEVSFAPKGRGLVRPGVRLSLADRVVYTAAVGACLRTMEAATRWSQKKIDFAPRLNPRALSKRQWLYNPFVAWQAWREESLRSLDLNRTSYVLTADIAGYFENIEISTLRSDLARIQAPEAAVTLLVRCLRHWTPPSGRGLPQGILASDVLAKLYLEAVDRRLKSEGFAHVRYADDFRIFCSSRPEAQSALVLLTEVLRDRGLTLQSAKTQIRTAVDVRPEFEGVGAIIAKLEQEYIDEALAAGLMQSDPSVPISVIDDLVNVDPNKIDPRILTRAFRRLVRDAQDPNRTVFHYLLRRLAATDDDYATGFCKEFIAVRPEETPAILRYFEDLDTPEEFEAALARVLRSKELVMYPYQRYLILDWYWRNATSLRSPTKKILRKMAFTGAGPGYLRVYARALLGRFGDHSDLDALVGQYSSASDPLERAQLLCSLELLEKQRRNVLLNRVKGEPPWLDRAVTYLQRSDGRSTTN